MIISVSDKYIQADHYLMEEIMYRKIFTETNGAIPSDSDGRTYEIHHIDGNHLNNDPSNLKCVSIQEHYDIHYAQGDWGACQAIMRRMKKTPEEISAECSELVKKNIKAGRMPQLTSEHARARELDRVNKGIHAWQGPEASKRVSERNLKRVADGLNPFAGDLGSRLSKQVQRDRIDNGTHHFAGLAGSKHSTELNLKMLAEGRHPSQNPVTVNKIKQKQLEKSAAGNHVFQQQIKNGTHPSQQEWTCPYCNRTGKGLSNASRHHFDNCKLKEKK